MINKEYRILLWGGLGLVLTILWGKWNSFNNPQTEKAPIVSNVSADVSAGTIPTSSDSNNKQVVPSTNTGKLIEGDIITVKTDLLSAKISRKGAQLLEVSLNDYFISNGSDENVVLLNNNPDTKFLLTSGLLKDGVQVNSDLIYSSDKEKYNLDGDTLDIVMSANDDGIQYEKKYSFKKGSNKILLEQKVTNLSEETWGGSAYRQLQRMPIKKKGGLASINTFMGAAYSLPGTNFKKLDFDDLIKKPLRETANGGWISMLQHYFAVGIIPSTDESNLFYSIEDKGLSTIGLSGPVKKVANGESVTFSDSLYIGPKIKEKLNDVAPNFDKTLDYGYLFFISEILFTLLNFFHSLLGNWGWAIVITTIVIKVLFFPLAAKSFKSMAKMRKAQPDIERIKKNYEGDRHMMGQEMMKLYKKEGINPASGCLPVLLQIPVFIAFYYMLMESIELRQAPWIFWIKDLSVLDPFYILPVLNGVLMFVQQKLNPPPSDPTQRKVMMALPVVFGVMFLFFPSGLVLYWVVSNLFSIVQHTLINKRYG